MRVIIAGSRDFVDTESAFKILDHLLLSEQDLEIISGGARGADKIGELWAISRNFPCKTILPDWNKYGKKAGYLRNLEMAQYASQDENAKLVAFWDGESRGTKHMIEIATKNNLCVTIINVNKEIKDEKIK